MARSKISPRLPSICIDENLSPAIAREFRDAGYRVIEIAKHPRLRGRDERDFIGELYSDNAVLVTGDWEYVDELRNAPRLHAGVVHVPQTFASRDKEWLAWALAQMIRMRCSDSRFGYRGRVTYAADEGFRTVHDGEDVLDISWDQIWHQMETGPTQRVRRRR